MDTIFLMLKSFDGRLVHIAGETYMKGNYDLKISTLRGATAIEGKAEYSIITLVNLIMVQALVYNLPPFIFINFNILYHILIVSFQST